jgi:uncharacterized protein (TIGR03435 family)
MNGTIDHYRARAAARVAARSVIACLTVVFAHPAGAQSGSIAQTRVTFDVTSVKLNRSGAGSFGNHFDSSRVTYTNVSVRELIGQVCRANGPFSQMLGGPGWSGSDRWDIIGTTPDPQDGKSHRALLEAMMCSLLEDRFQLVFHYESRMLPSYELVVAKGGSKMKGLAESETVGRGLRVSERELSGVSNMRDLAHNLRAPLHQVVTDHTELAGFYEFSLKYSSDGLDASPQGDPAAVPDPIRPSLFTAVQEQLGLKLVPQKTPQNVMVIDHVERPSEN